MFDQVTGHFGDLALQISGGITGGSGSTFQDFLIRVNGDADHMAKLLPSKAIPAGMIDGLVNGAVVLTGPTLSPHIRGEVVLTESKVTLPDLIEKPIGAQATVEFEGMIPQGLRRPARSARAERATDPTCRSKARFNWVNDSPSTRRFRPARCHCPACRNGLRREGLRRGISNCRST